MKRSSVVFALALSLSGLVVPLDAWALSAQKVQEIVRTANVLDPKYRQCTAAVSGDAVAVSVYKNPRATEEDCKIDSILLAKLIMDQDEGINLVKFSFYMTDGKSWHIDARKADVRAYATANVDKDALLGGIDVRKESPVSDLNQVLKRGVKAGPLLDDRATLMGRVRNLRNGDAKRGWDPLPTIDYFLKDLVAIEKQAEQGIEEGLKEKIVELDRKLSAEVSRVNALPPQTRAKLIADYKARHGMAVETSKTAATQQPTPPGMQVMTQAEYDRLKQKYPEFAVSSGGKEWKRRMVISYAIMKSYEQGRGKQYYLQEFKQIERLAQSDNDEVLSMRLRSMEAALGVSALSSAGR